MMSIYLKQDAAATLLYILYLCQVMIGTEILILLKGMTITVMLIMWEVYGVPKWISWKLTLLLGTLHLINATHL